MDDPRLREYWDGQGVMARWLFENRQEIAFEFFGGAAVWDSSLLFAPSAVWGDFPTELRHFGYTVIRRRADLERHLQALWAEASSG